MSGFLRIRGITLLPIEDEALYPLHDLLVRVEVNARRDGGFLSPPMQRFKETLALASVSSRGRVSRTPADIEAQSEGPGEALPVDPFMTTEQFADRLAVTTRSARRIAADAGVTPITRNAWAASDVAALSTLRRRAA
jgi:hypothetical protein